MDFWRAMASGDAAYLRGAMITRVEIEAAPGASEQAYVSAIAAYARAARILGPGGFDEAQTHLVRAAALMNAVERFQESLAAALVAEARFKALGHEYGRDLARFYWAWSMTYDALRMPDATETKPKFETARKMFAEVAANHLRRGERFDHAQALDGIACVNGISLSLRPGHCGISAGARHFRRAAGAGSRGGDAPEPGVLRIRLRSLPAGAESPPRDSGGGRQHQGSRGLPGQPHEHRVHRVEAGQIRCRAAALFGCLRTQPPDAISSRTSTGRSTVSAVPTMRSATSAKR